MLANWIKIFKAEIMLNLKGFTFSLIVDLRKLSAIPLKNESFPPCLSANYLDSFSKLLKGESRTTQPI